MNLASSPSSCKILVPIFSKKLLQNPGTLCDAKINPTPYFLASMINLLKFDHKKVCVLLSITTYNLFFLKVHPQASYYRFSTNLATDSHKR
jgi:hypothetical protein